MAFAQYQFAMQTKQNVTLHALHITASHSPMQCRWLARCFKQNRLIFLAYCLNSMSKIRFVTWLQRSDNEWSPSQSRTVRVGRNAHTDVSRARNASIPSHRQRKGSGAAADQSKLSLSRCCCCSTVLCALSNAAPTRQSVCTCWSARMVLNMQVSTFGLADVTSGV